MNLAQRKQDLLMARPSIGLTDKYMSISSPLSIIQCLDPCDFLCHLVQIGVYIASKKLSISPLKATVAKNQAFSKILTKMQLFMSKQAISGLNPTNTTGN